MNFLCVVGIVLFFLLPVGAAEIPDINNLELEKIDWSDFTNPKQRTFWVNRDQALQGTINTARSF